MNTITDFLKTKRKIQELQIALDVIREFKSHESNEEWLFQEFFSLLMLDILLAC